MRLLWRDKPIRPHYCVGYDENCYKDARRPMLRYFILAMFTTHREAERHAKRLRKRGWNNNNQLKSVFVTRHVAPGSHYVP